MLDIKLVYIILIIVALMALNTVIEPLDVNASTSTSDVIDSNLENCTKLAKEACRTPVLNAYDSFMNQYTGCDKIYPRNHQLVGNYSQCTNNVMTPLKCGDGDRETCFPEERVSEVCSAVIFNKCMSTVPRKPRTKSVIGWSTQCN